VSVRYKLVDVGRGKYNGVVEARTGEPEHVEAVVMRKIRSEHLLASRDVELTFEQDERGIVKGDIIVGGFRMAGRFEREVKP
jgi:hypothetical protein